MLATVDKMQTTAGSFALVGMSALQDSTVAAKLRAGGAVILGKTNLSEWANNLFRIRVGTGPQFALRNPELHDHGDNEQPG